MKLVFKKRDKYHQKASERLKEAEAVFLKSYIQYVMNTMNISVSAPYETFFIPVNSIKPGSCKFVKTGFKYFILNNKKPVSTVDISLSKNELSLSHFTFGGSVDAIMAAISKIERIKKYPAESFSVKIIKNAVLNIYALKLDSAKRSIYFNLNSMKKINGLSEKEFHAYVYDQKEYRNKQKNR